MNRMKRNFTPALLLCVTLAILAPCAGGSPARERAQTLRRGVNLSHWYSQSLTGGYSENHLSTWFTAEDIALIVAMGFDHVRLSLNDQVLFDEKSPGRLKEAPLAKFDQRLDALLAAGLKVIVDLHPDEDYKRRLHEPAAEAALLANWRALAGHLAPRDPARVFPELLNEPGKTWETDAWAAVQGRVLAAIREAAPPHTVIVAPGKWTAADDLLKLTPYDDNNLIYTFHWYEPYLFTHQGSEWGWDVAGRISGLGWPTEPADAETVIRAATHNTETAGHLRRRITGGQHRAAWMSAMLDQIADWQKRHGGVPVYVGEFGVYAKDAPAEARYRWHEESRKLFEARDWGWAVWDYRGGFHVAIPRNGKTVPDERMQKALGLTR
ncbi:endoglucanase [Opitutaceae bacterium TAV1]|nr:endoglucanase [Opitutaceae bacterium TAV1]